MVKAYLRGFASALAVTAGLALAAGDAQAQAKHYKLAYDQPVSTGYGLAGNIFAEKLKELSKGTMLIDQYPGAQLGQEPQVLQLVKAGDIEFCFSASANAATLSPQAGVMSLHFLFRDEGPSQEGGRRSRRRQGSQGHDRRQPSRAPTCLRLLTLGFRNIYAKKEGQRRSRTSRA